MLKFNAFRTSKRISGVHSSLIIPTNPTLTPTVARRNATTKATTHQPRASRPPPSEWRAVKGSSSTSTSTSKSVERTRETQFGDGMPPFMDLDSWPTELDPEALELDRQRKQEEQQRQQQSTINQSTSSSLSLHLPPTFTNATVKEGEEKKAEPSSSLPSSLLPPEVVNPQIQEALRDLYSAVARNELGQVVKAYHLLRHHHGLEKFVDADVTKVSQMLTDYLSHAPVKSEERKEAEEMSIFFCTRGLGNGICP
ncbi:hypothetical protein FRC15_001181 [Serendipita sp. 397]|nr:hypothetical protein FRC15_001181 [Serendipita sp. 397]